MTSGTDRPEDGDAIFDQFRRADPAQGSEPDLVTLRAATDRRIADPAFILATPPDRDDHDATSAGSSDSPADDDAPVRAERRTSRSGWVVAAAVATLLAVGAGGYIAGAQRSETPVVLTDSAADGDDSAERAEAPQEEVGTLTDDGQQDADSDEPMTMQDAESDDGADTAALLPVQFVDDGLPAETGQAQAWALDAAEVYSEQTLLDLAESLGMSGTASESETGWGLRDGASLTLLADEAATLRYYDEDANVPCALDQGQGRISDEVTADHECPGTEADPPQDPERTAAEFLDAIGVDTAGLDLVAEDDRLAMVNVRLVPSGVDPAPGATWRVTVSQHGVVAATGALAEPVSLGEYPTISAADAVGRLGDPRFTAHLWPRLGEPVAPGVGQQPGPPTAPDPGDPLTWPVDQVRLVEARLSLDVYTHPGTGALLLPTWELIDDQSRTWPVLAVAEDSLEIAVP